MLANISANCKIKSIKIMNPTSSKVIKGFVRQFKNQRHKNSQKFRAGKTYTGASAAVRLPLSFSESRERKPKSAVADFGG